MKGIISFWFLVIFLMGCDPVKRVMRNPDKKARAMSLFLQEGICRPDTFNIVKTDTLLQVDTVQHLYLTTDTAYREDTIYVIQTRWREIVKTLTIRDTVIRQIEDTRRLEDLQRKFVLMEASAIACRKDKRRQLWWLLALGLVTGGLVTYIIRRG
jgi:hypothetical protein